MTLKVTYENSDFPKGTEFDIRGLGLLQNGKTVTLTEEQEASFLAETGQSVKAALKGNEAFKVEGSSASNASGGDE